jgi:hypothetical protein
MRLQSAGSGERCLRDVVRPGGAAGRRPCGWKALSPESAACGTWCGRGARPAEAMRLQSAAAGERRGREVAGGGDRLHSAAGGGGGGGGGGAGCVMHFALRLRQGDGGQNVIGSIEPIGGCAHHRWGHRGVRLSGNRARSGKESPGS